MSDSRNGYELVSFSALLFGGWSLVLAIAGFVSLGQEEVAFRLTQAIVTLIAALLFGLLARRYESRVSAWTAGIFLVISLLAFVKLFKMHHP